MAVYVALPIKGGEHRTTRRTHVEASARHERCGRVPEGRGATDWDDEEERVDQEGDGGGRERRAASVAARERAAESAPSWTCWRQETESFPRLAYGAPRYLPTERSRSERASHCYIPWRTTVVCGLVLVVTRPFVKLLDAIMASQSFPKEEHLAWTTISGAMIVGETQR